MLVVAFLQRGGELVEVYPETDGGLVHAGDSDGTALPCLGSVNDIHEILHRIKNNFGVTPREITRQGCSLESHIVLFTRTTATAHPTMPVIAIASSRSSNRT